ncbi:dihydroorotase [Hydrogenophaga sp. BPS33]|uniref:dihydroorotase n=1 Tax=Hydrogenophaga sp. BPS33 TaxID=2651974 RepID=UPI00131F80F1|nr:amidohydrolase family protein [Hydrogenophaga sp. BPS33]QHE83504.1 amidohydrolase family protein [Hydrogenophaga sp. BPS33]
MFETVIRGGTVVGVGGTQRADVGIRDGVVQAVAEPGAAIEGEQVVDATGKLLLPGLVDAHVHIPGHALSSRLDCFDTATRAAAVGGVTTVMLMPTDDPRTATPEYFERKRQAGERESHVDFAIQAMISPRSETAEILAMARQGAVSFELFLAYGGNPEFTIGNDDYELHRLLTAVAEAGGIAGITPHSGTLIAKNTRDQKGYQNDRRVRYRVEREEPPPLVEAFVRTRPTLSESLGITRACTVAAETATKLHFRALSARSSIEHVRRFSDRVHITTEAMSHHLVFSEEEAFAFGPYGIIVPPIRSAQERDALRMALREGGLDMVVSDHSPVLVEDKDLGWEDIWKTPPGMPGLQTLLPSMLILAQQGVVSLGEIVRVCCEQPARAFGLFPRKGAIAPGADADLVLLDPERRWRVTDAAQHSRARYTTLKGREVHGGIDAVYLRGELLVQNDVVQAGPRGRFVRP